MVKAMIAEEMKYLTIAKNIQVVVYVAKDGVTEEQMQDHFQQKMIPWLKSNAMTEVLYWIARHGDLLSIIVQVDVYRSDWSEIPDIHKLYRSDSEKVLMKVHSVREGNIVKD